MRPRMSLTRIMKGFTLTERLVAASREETRIGKTRTSNDEVAKGVGEPTMGLKKPSSRHSNHTEEVEQQ